MDQNSRALYSVLAILNVILMAKGNICRVLNRRVICPGFHFWKDYFECCVENRLEGDKIKIMKLSWEDTAVAR